MDTGESTSAFPIAFSNGDTTFTESSFNETSTPCNMSNICDHQNLTHNREAFWAIEGLRLENLVCPPVIMSVGIIGNILSFLVMIRKEMRKTSIGIYLMVIAISDSLVCNSFYPNNMAVAITGRQIYTGAANNISLFLSYVGGHTTAWLIVALTVDRFISVTFPLRAKSICTPHKAKRIVLSVVIFFVLFDGINWLGLVSHEVLTPDTQMYIGRTDGVTEYINYIWHLIDSILMNLMPSPIIITLNSIIIYTLRKMKRKRLEIARQTQQIAKEGADKKLYVMLITVSMVFSTITIPYYAWTIYSGYIEYWTSRDNEESAIRSLILFSFIHLYCMNHSINFFIYCLTGKKFRSELKRLFQEAFMKCCRRQTSSERGSERESHVHSGSAMQTAISVVSLEFVDMKSNQWGKSNDMTVTLEFISITDMLIIILYNPLMGFQTMRTFIIFAS